MTYSASGRWSGDEHEPSVQRLREILSELDIAVDDIEHPDVSLKHETEWALSVFSSGLLIWENVEEGDEPRHMRGVSREKVLSLWLKLAEGDIEGVAAELWLPGYGAEIPSQ